MKNIETKTGEAVRKPVDVEINWEVVHVQIEQIKRRGWSVKFTWHKRASGEEWAVEICDGPGSIVQATDRELSAAIAKAVLHAGAETP